jgi:hypothetical protein
LRHHQNQSITTLQHITTANKLFLEQVTPNQLQPNQLQPNQLQPNQLEVVFIVSQFQYQLFIFTINDLGT